MRLGWIQGESILEGFAPPHVFLFYAARRVVLWDESPSPTGDPPRNDHQAAQNPAATVGLPDPRLWVGGWAQVGWMDGGGYDELFFPIFFSRVFCSSHSHAIVLACFFPCTYFPQFHIS